MHVVHVCRAPDGRLAVWAECDHDGAAHAGCSDRRAAVTAGPVAAHPAASDHAQLERFLDILTAGPLRPVAVDIDDDHDGDVATGPAAGDAGVTGDPVPATCARAAREATVLDLRLPTRSAPSGARPVPSTGSSTGDGADGFATWRVPAVVVSSAEALAVAERLAVPVAASAELPDGVVAGDAWRVLGAFAEFAMVLCAGGRVVPVVEDGRPRWAPAPDAEARSRFALLAASLPPSYLAAEPCAARASDAAAEVVEAFCDVVVRSALSAQGWRPHLPAMQLAEPELHRVLDGLAVAPDAGARASRRPDDGVDGGRHTDAVAQAALPLAAPLPVSPELVSALAARRRRLQPPRAALRACFRLVDPPAPELNAQVGSEVSPGTAVDDPTWRLEFLAQSAHDPSLLVDAAEIWSGGEAARLVSGTAADAPDDEVAAAVASTADALLAELGRSGSLVPVIAAALSDAAPTGVALRAADVVEFLTHDADRLETAGFPVLVPAWWRRRAGTAGLRVRPGETRSASSSAESPVTGGGLGLTSIVDVDWDFLLDGVALGAEDLSLIADLKAPLVRVQGNWVFCTDDVREAVVAFATGSTPLPSQIPLAEALEMRARAHSGADADVEWHDSEEWRRSLALVASGPDGTDADDPAVALPASFVGELRPYQHRGVAWLRTLEAHGLGACLADDMGLGKTVQVLATIDIARAEGLHGTTLLVCPTSLIGNWVREARRFVPDLRVHVQHGASRPRAEHLSAVAHDADLVITSYSIIARDLAEFIQVPWVRLVLDEAQNVKNADAHQARAARAVAAAVPRRVALTGTPVENRLAELRSIMEILNPGLLGSADQFRQRFAVPIERHRDDAATRHLTELVAPFVLRRTKSDRRIVPELPDKVERTERCELTAEQVSLYRAVVDELLDELPDGEPGGGRGSRRGSKASVGDDWRSGPPLTEMQRRGRVLASIGRLKAVCNHPAQLTGDDEPLDGRSGKLARLEDVVDEILAEGGRALVFTQFPTFGRRLRDHLTRRFGVEVLFLHGGTPRAERDAMVARFQAADGEGAGLFDAPPLFLLSLKAGGVGLNLTAASHVLHFDRWWNPAVESQATDRAYRIGQHRNVQVRTFVSTGTIEDRIDELLRSKQDLADLVIGNVENWLSDLDPDRIHDLVRLDDAVVAAASAAEVPRAR